MKSFIIASLLMTGLVATASVSGVKAIYTDYDQVLGIGPGSIALDNACVTDSEVKTIAPVRVCTNLVPHVVPRSGDTPEHTDWVCEAYAVRQLSASRDFSRSYCAAYAPRHGDEMGECAQWGTRADRLPDTIKITVVSYRPGDAGDDFPGRSSMFTFPRCAN